MRRLILAPGVQFDEAEHVYWYKDHPLSGITRLIGQTLGEKMPERFVEEHRLEGIHIHKAVQEWIASGRQTSAHPVVQWIIETLPGVFKGDPANLYAEVLVSDFDRYASSVDIIAADADGRFTLFDIKKGVFKRESVTWQLSVYKYLIEEHTGHTVARCTCICGKDREYYPILPKSREKVRELLYGEAV